MKKIYFLVFIGIVLFQFSASAQILGQKELYTKKVETYTKMKNAGKGLTFGGAILTVVGVGLIVDAVSSEMDNDYYDSSEDAKAMGGILAVELGTVMTTGGIVLWTIGASKSNKYSSKLKGLSLNLNPDIHKKLSLTYTF